MPRIPTPELERLKAEVAVRGLVEASGVALRRAGKDWLGCCPFHEDREASLVVSPAKNLWHCFGCQVGGGPIDWVMKREGSSFRQAVERLQGLLPLAAHAAEAVAPLAAKETSAPTGATAQITPTLTDTTGLSLGPNCPLSLQSTDDELLAQVLGHYQRRLEQTAQEAGSALAYLKARGLEHPGLVAHFGLGVADRSLGLTLPEKNRKAGGLIRARLQRLGVLRESGHEHFNGSLVVPVLDEAGRVVEIYGRKLLDNLRPGTPKHLYLPGRSDEGIEPKKGRGVFNLPGVIAAGQRAPGQRELILCEALIDAMSFWCAGFSNVTSAYGIEGFADELLATIKAQHIERIFIAYDRDEAGERAALKLAPRLAAEGLEVLRVVFPQGLDANEYARKFSPAAESLALVLRQAVWLGGVRQVEQAPAQPQELPPPPSLAAKAAISVPEPEAEDFPAELQMQTGLLRWRVWGWQKNPSAEVLKIKLQARHAAPSTPPEPTAPGLVFVDSLDLYAARSRGAFARAAALELGVAEDVLKRELGAVLLRLEALQDAWLSRSQQGPKTVAMSAEDQAQALALLQDPNLLGRIVADMQALGVVGEEVNLKAAYLAAISRKLSSPLAVLIQSTSAAGKSALMDAVLQLVPDEDKQRFSAMTGQSLFYLGETNLKHKILAIAEEEGVRQAAYALKLLQSDGELTMASTAKDEATGKLSTQHYRVQGPVMLMLTTTAIDVDEELLNRCLVLTVNESPEQTRAIHARQRQAQTLQGLLAKTQGQHLVALHHNAQRLLAPLAVVNPYAQQLGFAADKTRTRRDHMKYLTLIQAVTLLHQHQREIKTAEVAGQTLHYIEVTRQDIRAANAMAHEVLGRTLDELPPQTRRLLGLISRMVAERAANQSLKASEVRFTRKDIREATQWSDNQLKVHCARLAEMEFLLIHSGARGHSLRYELLWDGQAQEQRHLCGLIDPDLLSEAAERQADPPLRFAQVGVQALQVGAKLAPSCPQVGVKLEGVNPPAGPANAGDSPLHRVKGAEMHIYGEPSRNPVVAVSL